MAAPELNRRQLIADLPNSWGALEDYMRGGLDNIREVQRFLEYEETSNAQGKSPEDLFKRVLLMTCYLCTDSLNEARYLFSRVNDLEEIKTLDQFPEFDQFWKMGQCLFKTKYVPTEGYESPFHFFENYEFSPMGAVMCDVFAGHYRLRKCEEISGCFSSIQAAELAEQLGFNPKELDHYLDGLGWTTDESGVVFPAQLQKDLKLKSLHEIRLLRTYLQSTENHFLLDHKNFN